MPNWVIERVLATSPRPGYQPGPEHRVEARVVEEWCVAAREFGVSSILCLIGNDQLWLYRRALPHGLLAAYREAGFVVHHLPTLDQLTHPFTTEQYEEAWAAFLRLPKPVLVHCSAGMDRTGRIVGHIVARLGEDGCMGAAASG
ncbi:MAG: tyrosine-protein phosphatase [Gemmataceae bacterium]|nr:tyrosine-protein phosphatase [Gemmataceae bacterium]